jgi:hypothetical protein
MWGGWVGEKAGMQLWGCNIPYIALSAAVGLLTCPEHLASKKKKPNPITFFTPLSLASPPA